MFQHLKSLYFICRFVFFLSILCAVMCEYYFLFAIGCRYKKKTVHHTRVSVHVTNTVYGNIIWVDFLFCNN